LTEENYAGITASANIWNCPTLYNFSVEWSTENAQSIFKNSELTELLPRGTVEIWLKRLNNVPKQARGSVNKNGPGNIALMKEIVLNLYKSDAKLIAGTDAGSIPFLVPGFSLQEELRTLQEVGISIYDVLKMTTSNAASAMNKQSEFGTIEEGKRADLLLLDANPLRDLKNLKKKSGMMIRGIWLSHEDLQKISNQMKTIFSN
jgi:imidazolonepropionase-like amidohydrolase